MYTTLRTSGIKGGMKRLILDILSVLGQGESIYAALGGGYLLAYYTFYTRVRDWVHKEDYF